MANDSGERGFSIRRAIVVAAKEKHVIWLNFSSTKGRTLLPLDEVLLSRAT
jgi:hypothetical protein